MEPQDLQPRLAELCRALKLPTIARHTVRLAESARRQGQDPLDFLVEVLDAELCERKDRGAQRRIKEAGFPLVKTLEGFDFAKSAQLPEGLLRQLAGCRFIAAAEPVLLLGEPGTGKTHLATALGVAAARHGYSVR